MQNLTDDNTPNVIKSIARFHVNYTIARFIKNPTLMQEYITPEAIKAVRSHIPIKYREFDSQTTDGDGNYFTILAAVNYSDKDYKSMISYRNNGITEVGRGLFQQSLEVYIRSILGAQADVCWSIIGKGAMSLQSREQFRSHVKSLIVLPDLKELVSDMRTAIQATHVILDTVIIPGVSLISSSLVILKEPIPGYNNILLTANSNMNFGLNSDVNRTKREVQEPKPNPIKVFDKPDKPNLTKVSKEPEKQSPQMLDDTFQKDEPVEVDKGVNPVILFISAIGFGVVISHSFS